MAAVATKLGLSSDDLKTQLKSGKSLDDIATAQGVSHDDLISAIKSGMPADSADVSSSATSATDLVKMLQSKGVDLNQLKSVLNSGDLVDVSA